ncbi:MAG: DUF362 domain-containing protein [Deltaproteobacteria bacterium]|jgi:uncharacterized protein (DUF362 family)|nr:DUF362 domain-containing protein [Deltaproteobacteria bacterium]MBW2503950.1 DUF362 domain-containing protein [Deltaproteobacteria bacterium]
MTLPVALNKLSSYEPEHVENALRQLLEPLGGMKAFVKPGQKVLIKPNLLMGKPPEKAVTTHPEIVRQTILLAQEAGGIIYVGDSPGLGKSEVVARKCGVYDVIKSTGATFAPFEVSRPITIKDNSGTFHHLEVAADVMDADVIINLPKLKTHQMMGLTGAVKNLFGLIVGMRKVRMHLQAGTNKSFFALMLLELAERFEPALTIMDAVLGMEGNGPGSGEPVLLKTVLASKHTLALDAVAIALVGLSTDKVWTQKVAYETGRLGSTLDQVKLLGTPLEELKVSGFRPAKTSDINFGLPAPFKNLLKNSVTSQPSISADCQLCGQCISHCPPSAMKIRRGQVTIDYGLCIRCFCCQELCPHGAIKTEQGLLLRLYEFINQRR